MKFRPGRKPGRLSLKPATALILALVLSLLVHPAFAMAAGRDSDADKKDLMILYTSDVHCGVDQGFGYDGLFHLKEEYKKKGYNVILVDNGDAIQGEALGLLTEGASIIDLMNKTGYEIAIPGNHEFDYGMDVFLELAEKAEFPYISCNFTYEDELVFDPYIIKEFDGISVGFVGITTPESLTTTNPSNFIDEDGNYVYGFCEDRTGKKLYRAVQDAVDGAREEGADYIVVMGHLGNEDKCRPFTYADVISNTNGIDIFLDGHSHDTDQVVMKNKDGGDVIRSACGTKLASVGWAKITQDGEKDAGIYTWPNTVSPASLFGLENDITDSVAEWNAQFEDILSEKVGETQFLLTICDPVEKDSNGLPVRMIRRAETNLGDLTADAYLACTGADIALINAGSVRRDIPKGVITKEAILGVHPYGNALVVVKADGQQILDALEWGARSVPDENGGFLQVAGLSYEIHSYIDSGCTFNENGLFTGIEGERRVRNVMTDDGPLDPGKTYKVACSTFLALNHGDGFTQFSDCETEKSDPVLDYQALLDYIKEDLGGKVGQEYSELTGDGRIVIVEEEPKDSKKDTGKTDEEKTDAGEPEGSGSGFASGEPTPIASEEYADTAAKAMDGFLSAFRKFDMQKIAEYAEKNNINSFDSEEFYSIIEDPSALFGSEDMPEGSAEAVLDLMSYVLDYDYEISESRTEGDDVYLDVTLITYDFTSVSEDFLGDFMAKAMTMYLKDPDLSEDAAILVMFESLNNAFAKLEDKTEKSTDEIRCFLEDGIWYADFPEDYMDKMTGNFNDMMEGF